jgi:hypothetical protein
MASNVLGVGDDGPNFLEFRRKVRQGEVLAASVERLAKSVHFSGRVMVLFDKGRIIKCGYEEGYFRQRAGAEETE